MLKEFKEFVMRGNVLDLAVAVIIGAAFGKIVSSLVGDVLMPPIGRIIGKLDFSSIVIPLARPEGVDITKLTLKAATDMGLPVIKVGLFLNNVIDFVIVAFVIFLVIKLVNRMQRKKAAPPAEPTTKECPFCLSVVSLKAVRCPHCTSQLETAAK
ncbi:MAG: large conductance mechanosensitive channel protein MscL [Candidatus Edwardsbacteria bacterium]|jgi:large conductance mechanosensitive channel|nr:large conductance mechanosensitive channel protein MscL [Candidatus Edwardsbacteria bacterium]